MNNSKPIEITTRLYEWMAKLSGKKLPVFAATARSLADVSRDKDSSAEDLSNIILHDSAMTARILRIANSAHYNPGGDPIETVSYATVVLGFEQVRNLALTVSMIDTVLGVEPKKQIEKETICAYHAAVQAQRLIKDARAATLEAVYIGALLHRLGPLMFWCFPFDHGKMLLNAYDQFEDPKRAERAILGFALDDLTTALVSEWHLSPLLERTLVLRESKGGDERAISIGSRIADNIHHGWESASIRQEIHAAGKHLDISTTEARNHVYSSARIAKDGLESFGFSRTQSLTPPESKIQAKPVSQGPDNSKLELRIIRQLTKMLGGDMDINRVLLTALEGIYRVLEMDQVVFAVADSKQARLHAKIMIGKRRDSIINSKSKGHSTGEYLKQLLATDEPQWMTSKKLLGLKKDAIDPLLTELGAAEFFIYPIVVRGRPIGVVYADRYAHQTPLRRENLQSFCHLAEHSALAFKILSR